MPSLTYFRLLIFFTAVLCISLNLTLINKTSNAATLEDIINQSKEKKTMRSIKWHSKKTDNEENTKKNDKNSNIYLDEDKKIKKEDEEDKDKNEVLTPEQKLWKKYRDLAAGITYDVDDEDDSIFINEGEENKDKSEDEHEENNDSDIDNEKDKTENKDSPAAIMSILEEYKKSQKNKGKMNSRSFGKID